MPFEIDPRVDFAFKRLFGVESNKELLIDLLNAVRHSTADERIVEVELLDPFNLRDFQGDKLSIVDLRARDQLGRWLQVEMQMIGHQELVRRFVFYGARTYASQLKDGQDYAQLRPTIVIAFLCEPLFPQVADYHLTFRLMDGKHGIRFTDDLEFHTIELCKLTERPVHSSGKLDRWSYFLNFAEGHEVSQFPEVMQEDPVFQKAFGELKRMSDDPDEREEYEKRLRAIRDENARTATADRRGREKGLAEGRAEGRAEMRLAALKDKVRLLERLLRHPESSDAALQALTIEQLERTAAELEHRCLSAPGGVVPPDDSDSRE
jgi:predicted transposase/invertase (TIGR01784 family)